MTTFTVDLKNATVTFDPTKWSDEFKVGLWAQGVKILAQRVNAEPKDGPHRTDEEKARALSDLVDKLVAGTYVFGAGRGPQTDRNAVLAKMAVKAWLTSRNVATKVIVPATKGTTLDQVRDAFRTVYCDPVRVKKGDTRSSAEFAQAVWTKFVQPGIDALSGATMDVDDLDV